MFGHPCPKGHAEIVEAMDEFGAQPHEIQVMIDEPGPDGFDGNGWSADLMGITSEDVYFDFSTLAYDSKDELLADLKASGLTDIQEDN